MTDEKVTASGAVIALWLWSCQRPMGKKVKPGSVAANPLRVWAYAAWVVAAGAWLLTAAALFSYHPADPPGFSMVMPPDGHGDQPIHNWVGRFGAVVAHELYLMIGPGIWVGLACGLCALLLIAAGRRITQPLLRAAGALIMSLAASCIMILLLPVQTQGGWLARQWSAGLDGGGLLPTFINTQLIPRFAMLGTLLVLGVALWLGAILAADYVVVTALGWAVTRLSSLALPRWRRPAWAAAGAGAAGLVRLPGLLRWRQRHEARAACRPGRRRPDVEGRINEDAGGLGATEPFDPDQEVEAVIDDADELDPQPDEVRQETASQAPASTPPPKKFDPEALRAKIKAMPINIAARLAPATVAAPAPPRQVDLSGYEFPGLDILIDPEHSFTKEMEDIVRDQAIQLESALQQYRIEGEVVGIDSGPVITLYEVRLAPGTKVSVISRVASDLARALKAQNIRIVPNTAGKDTIGIEVPNLKKERVRLKELMTAQAETARSMNLPMFLGKDASGNVLIQDLTTMPHMLLAGTTGSGKSVCINSIIASFLYTKRPDELKLVLVDPKMVELSMFRDIPHLMCPVVTEMSRAAAILEWATTKMDERYELLAEAGVRDIAGYNALTWEELKDRFAPADEAEAARIPKKLPYLVFIIDELADLILTNKEVEGFIVRLAQKARAVGLHLILATQRPQANVVTGLIKGNMPCRISFKVASGLDSRIVLDQKGAELLLGQGDMLFLSPRSPKLIRAQGTLVEDIEIRRMVRFCRSKAEQAFEPQLMQLKAAGAPDEEVLGDEKDPMFDDAVRVVLETKRGSVSLLQRRLAIGYTRASRLIEQMAQAGLLGDYKGTQAREVTITLEEWEALKAQAEADAAAQQAAAPADTATALADDRAARPTGNSADDPDEELDPDDLTDDEDDDS